MPAGAYQPVRRKVVGCGSSTSKLASAYKDQLWHAFIGRLDKDTTESFVSERLEMNGISISKVSQLSPREDWQKRSAAFRVSFACSAKDAIFEPSLWPSGIETRDWYFKSTTKGVLMPRTLPIMKMDNLTSMLHSKRFKICSFNMHGFLNGFSIFKELCPKFDIILLQ